MTGKVGIIKTIKRKRYVINIFQVLSQQQVSKSQTSLKWLCLLYIISSFIAATGINCFFMRD